MNRLSTYSPPRLIVTNALLFVVSMFLALHLTRLPRSLEDMDSINLAMGVRQFDVSLHQPHPPGYPVFIAMAKVSTAVMRAAGSSAPEAHGLAMLGVLAGSLAVVPLFAVFRLIDGREVVALVAAAAAVATPLFWFTASRPLTDVTGLVAALFVQALALRAWRLQRDSGVSDDSARRAVYWAALTAGFAIGLRSQTFLLTLPLGMWVTLDPRIPHRRRGVLMATTIFTIGVLLWGVPLAVASGGVNRYLAALNDQAQQDFGGVTMLWTHPSLRLLRFSLIDTFVRPWSATPLAATMIGLSVVGLLALARRSLESTILLGVAIVPYAVFHLLFHETATIRYALPLIPVMVFLSVVAVDAVASLVTRGTMARTTIVAVAGAALIAVSLVETAPALRAYASIESPAFRALEDAAAKAPTLPSPPALVMHESVRRAFQWEPTNTAIDPLPFQRSYEWMEAVRYWLGGGRAPVWFLARAIRMDLALIDPRHRNLVASYRWPFDPAFTGGARPGGVDWFSIEHPNWFLDKGWSLTPETAGVATAGGDGPETTGSVAHLARLPEETRLMIGGRQVGDPAAAAHVNVALDGRTLIEWDQHADPFLKIVTLPAGALSGAGDYARLIVTASPIGGPGAVIRLEQFDFAPSTEMVWGYGAGWHEPEFDLLQHTLWRWMSDRSTLEIPPSGQAVIITLTGEAPVKQLGRTPTLTVRAGDQTIDAFSPNGMFRREIVVPEAAVRAAGGHLVLDSDTSFVPNEQSGNGDQRRLAVRIFSVTVR